MNVRATINKLQKALIQRKGRESMSNEQVNALRDLAETQDTAYKKRIINKAADSIKSFSAKLQAYENEIMTIDEAIEHLNDILQPEKKWECEKCRNEHIKLREWLIELKQHREKQIPKEPVDRCMFHECPLCGNVEIQHCSYCPNCGQALKTGTEIKTAEWKEHFAKRFGRFE